MMTAIADLHASRHAVGVTTRETTRLRRPLTALPDERTGLLVGGLAELENGNNSDPARLRKVAAEFESLLIEQLLKFARASSSPGWLGSEGDSAGTTMSDVAEQQLARAIAAGGGLGLATLLVRGLSQIQARKPPK